ncbi:hypothetical protein [Niabella sp.]|uniref:hypothetical protein n=1 Tax=Niabella sp. TaxID=1962976 RepID=UPI00262B3098|nr:hypothetical protein [Niabella sp.]
MRSLKGYNVNNSRLMLGTMHIVAFGYFSNDYRKITSAQAPEICPHDSPANGI